MKEYKKGLKKALDLLMKQQRYYLCWECMAKDSKGDYVVFDDMYKVLLEELRK